MALLPNNESLLFVPPCGSSYPDNEQFRLYYCPARRSRRDTGYLGIYAGKRVRSIGRIEKVVTCDISPQTRVIRIVEGPDNLTPQEEARILGAVDKASNHRWNITQGFKFYLCEQWAETNFVKTSRNGIQGHRYFDLGEVLGIPLTGDLPSIAFELAQKTWT